MIYAVLIMLGLCLGSFINALVWRVHQQSLPKNKRKGSDEELSLGKGRSMCPHCGHTLHAADLIPLFSWLAQRGKCRYCKSAISWQYPVVEALTAVLFVFSYIVWPLDVSGWEILTFSAWLVALTGLIALFVYDARWMLLPNRIIFPLYGVAVVYVLSRTLELQSARILLDAVLGVIVGGGFFYLLFRISNGKWIGGGDVKLGFLLGALVGSGFQALLVLFLASVLGTLYILPKLVRGESTRNSKIPFGPFLIAAAIVTVFFGQSLVDWYISSFIDI